MQSLTITKPDDFHLHLRDGAAMASIVNHTAAQFSRAIIMPNLKPPIITTEMALAYRDRILECVDEQYNFEPLMTVYLTDNTSPDEINIAAESNNIKALKYYPAGASTNSDQGVTDIKKTYTALEAMMKTGLPLLVHGEVTDSDVDVFDREAVFIDKVLSPLVNDFADLKIVFEHITTRVAVDFVMQVSANITATITPQHVLLNRNDLFKDGLQPHHYCLPILKAEDDRKAVLEAATSGNSKFFPGTDSAPHARTAKERSCGCAGIFSAHIALELYAEAFEGVGQLDKLEAFASHYGADFYGLPRNEDKITLVKQDKSIPETYPFGDDELVPFRAGDTCTWQLKN
ncbi:MAG: dihydroorotase [Proteobacteria bacterium]|nr:dihydroorotase [Pseudomonadota bacterium]